MKVKGKNLLRWFGVVEVLLGIGGFFLFRWILGSTPDSVPQLPQNQMLGALGTTIAIYFTLAVQVVAGIVGIALGGNLKKAGVCYFFGILLTLAQTSAYFSQGFEARNILNNTLMMLPTAMYFCGAAYNKKQAQEQAESETTAAK